MKRHIATLYLSIFIFFSLALWHNFTQRGAQHFTILAEGFLEGRLDMLRADRLFGTTDVISYQGKSYWASPPFPAIPLMPFVYLFRLLGLQFYQGYLQFLISIAVFFLSFVLAKRFRFDRIDSLFLAFAFCFASNYSFVVFFTGSWFYSQPFTALFFLLAFREWYGKKRWALIGLYLACIIATRPTAGLGGIFFVLSILSDKISGKEKAISLIKLFIPIVISVLLICGYNKARFGNPLETGYIYNNVKPEIFATMRNNHGLFKLENIPTNIYWNFLAPPEPVFENGTYHLIPPFFRANPIGMSFFIMSPLFLLIFKTLKKIKKTQIFLWVSAFSILLSLLMWYSAGYFQIGARYVLDLLPILYILLLTSFDKPKLNLWHRWLIIITAVLNYAWMAPHLFA